MTPGQFDLLQNADVPRSDVCPANWTCCHRALSHQVSFIYWTMQTYLGQVSVTCRRMQAYQSNRKSYIFWYWFICVLLLPTKDFYHATPREETTPQKYISWMNNWQVTQVTYAALYKYEEYLQSRPIHSYPLTSNSCIMTPRYYFYRTGRCTPW